MSAASDALSRPALVRRGLALNWLTIGYNVVEAVVAIGAGVVSGSVALLGFGLDSVIEVTASGAAQWRLRADLDPVRRAHAERTTLRIIGWSFLALAAYVVIDSALTLLQHEPPERSVVGLVLLALSAVVMPLLARAKRRVAREMSSRALDALAAHRVEIGAQPPLRGAARRHLDHAVEPEPEERNAPRDQARPDRDDRLDDVVGDRQPVEHESAAHERGPAGGSEVRRFAIRHYLGMHQSPQVRRESANSRSCEPALTASAPDRP